MTEPLQAEIFWLISTILMTAIIWAPYIVNRILEHGLWTALKNPNPDGRPKAAWAIRTEAAHKNAVENLIIFAPLVLAIQITGLSTPMTATAAMVYFFARFSHLVIYVLGIPLLRTVAFFIGFIAQMVLVFTLLGQL